MFSVKQMALCIVSEGDGCEYPLCWWLVPSAGAMMNLRALVNHCDCWAVRGKDLHPHLGAVN